MKVNSVEVPLVETKAGAIDLGRPAMHTEKEGKKTTDRLEPVKAGAEMEFIEIGNTHKEEGFFG